MAAISALKNSWAMHHPTRTTGMLGANATMRVPVEPPTSPMTIQGRRMPSRDEVRSLSLPASGLANIDNKEPTPATTAKLPGARSIPTSDSIFNANVTSNGAISSRMLDMNAAVYRAMKPQLTGCTSGEPVSGAASAVRYSSPSTAAEPTQSRGRRDMFAARWSW